MHKKRTLNARRNTLNTQRKYTGSTRNINAIQIIRMHKQIQTTQYNYNVLIWYSFSATLWQHPTPCSSPHPKYTSSKSKWVTCRQIFPTNQHCTTITHSQCQFTTAVHERSAPLKHPNSRRGIRVSFFWHWRGLRMSSVYLHVSLFLSAFSITLSKMSWA